jgi:tetratricopeptide (TPR) repeat protein
MAESRIDEHALLKEARDLKEDATASRNLEEYDEAQKTLDEAIALLSSQMEEIGWSALTAKDIRTELADTFGMKGGVFRRSGNIAEALNAYRKGQSLEDIDKESTYNLSNVIALSITADRRSPNDPALRKDIESAIERLERATKGKRKDEWWAWADLAQFYLLHNEPDTARSRYARGRREAGPTKNEIRRNIAILEELAGYMAGTAPEIAANLREAIAELSEWL